MKAKAWIFSWLIIVLSAFCITGYLVYDIDPFFHYHKPKTDRYYYTLDNPRSQNAGICKHFDYDAEITGSSMTRNFRTTEAEQLFHQRFIKPVYTGATFKEVNDGLVTALQANPDLKTVIRCLDTDRFFDPWYAMRGDLGQFPD